MAEPLKNNDYDAKDESTFSVSPSSVYETGQIILARNTSTAKSYFMSTMKAPTTPISGPPTPQSVKSSTISPTPSTPHLLHPVFSSFPIQNNSISDAAKFKQNYIAYPLTKQQYIHLLANLKQRREANKFIQQRLIDDQKQFKQIEKILNIKIKKYQQKIKKTLQNLAADVDDEEDVDFDHIDCLLDDIIDIDMKSDDIKEVIRKKKSYQNGNKAHGKIVENNQMLDNIDNITQKIDYWQQLIANTSNEHEQIKNNEDNRDNESASFLIEEALQIRSENEKILYDLRRKLDQIRANKN